MLWSKAHFDSPDSSAGKESACNAGDLSSIRGLGRSPGKGKGYPLQYPGLENSMDCSPPGLSVHGDSPGKSTEVGSIPPPGHLPNPGIESKSPALKVNSLSSEPPGKPKNTAVGS